MHVDATLKGLGAALILLATGAGAQDAGRDHPRTRPAPARTRPAATLRHEGETLITNVRQVTFEGARSGEAYFSPDMDMVCFQSVRGACPHYQIFVKRLDGTLLRRISPGQGMTTCSYFHPRKPRMIWASTHLDPATYPEPPPMSRGEKYRWEKHPSFDIFSSDLEGHDLVRLTETPGYDAEGSYSPDGSRIVFTSERDGDYEIYTMAEDGSDVQRITRAEGYDGGPFFGPQGRRICFRGFRDPENPRFAHIYVINADGTGEQRLTTRPAVNWAPYWHPSGEYLVYTRNHESRRNFELFLLPVDGGSEVRVTTHPGADVLPVFSPDGKRLMWTSTRVGGRSQVFIADFAPPEGFPR